MSKKANLFVVGAMKAGTTSFVEMLSQHPEVYMSPIKEPHFFVENLPTSIYSPSRFFNLESYFEKKFPKPLHIAHLKKEEHYEKLFSLASNHYKYLAEASTGYLHDYNAAQNIYNYNPNAKIIILLRDPLKRAFSHYKMDLGLGRTTASFQEIITQEIQDYNNGVLSNWSYIGMSLYDENVARYRSRFGENVHIINLKEFKSKEAEAIAQLNEFLESSTYNYNLQNSNVSKSLRFQKLFFLIKQSGLKDLFSFVLPQSVRHKMFDVLSRSKSLSLELESDTLEKVNQIFMKANHKQQDIL